jgi:hypothetical protein
MKAPQTDDHEASVQSSLFLALVDVAAIAVALRWYFGS